MKPLSSSVGARTVLATTIMLLPMLLMAAAGAFHFVTIVDDVAEAEEEVRLELVPVIELQTLMLKAAMPPNDYLIHGGRHEREQFFRFADRIDLAIEELDAGHFGEAEERDAIQRISEHWRHTRVLGEELIMLPYPLENRQAAADQMELFDKAIDDATVELEKLYKYVIAELGEHVGRVKRRKTDAIVTTVVAFAIAILIAIIGGLVLARTILNPIRALDEGVSQLREGHLNHRVAMLSDDELGELGKTLNAMATRIERLATRDDLTGLYVRREFNRFGNEEISRAKRSGLPFSLLLVDVDHFKHINDRHGHRAGDRALRTLALVLNRDMRAVDRVARIGGEEFAVIMPDTAAEAAMETAERIRRMAAERKVHIPDESTIAITISVGVATFPEHGESMDALVEAADQALYRAKAAGRNCVQQATSAHPSIRTRMDKTA